MTLHLEETIQKIRQYSNVSFPIFSIYLSIPQNEKTRNQQLRTQFTNSIDNTLTQEHIALYQQDLNYIAAYLDDYKHTDHYKGIAIFSGGNKLWEVITTYSSLPNTVTVGHSPNLEPLLEELSNFRRFLVVLADRQKARYFTLHMGHVESQGGIDDPNVPQKVKGRNMSELSGKVDRHIRMHLQQHMKFIGNKVNEFVKNKQISGVIIGGHKEIMHNLKENLPKHLRKKIVGEFISELNTSMNAIVNESKKAVADANSRLNRQHRFY